MYCIAGSAILAAGMGSVTGVTKMEPITISAILCLTFMTTMKSFRNTGRQRSSTSPSSPPPKNVSCSFISLILAGASNYHLKTEDFYSYFKIIIVITHFYFFSCE